MKPADKTKCSLCGDTKTAKEREVNEEGVLGYYPIKVVWCDECTRRHNHYLMASWGGGGK